MPLNLMFNLITYQNEEFEKIKVDENEPSRDW